jgi:hypothetical protein
MNIFHIQSEMNLLQFGKTMKILQEIYCVFTQNREFLDYVSVAVDSFIIEHTQENKIKHFGIVCLNNIIDIATCHQPIIEEIT